MDNTEQSLLARLELQQVNTGTEDRRVGMNNASSYAAQATMHLMAGSKQL